MPQPPANAEAADQLIAVYRAAQARLEDRFADIAQDQDRWRERSRVSDLLASIDREVDALQLTSRGWVKSQIPVIYGGGAQSAADSVGSAFTWTQSHREAVQAIAERTFGDLLDATEFVRTDSKQIIRTYAKSATERALLESVTAQKSGADLAEAIRAETGFGTIRYANGARHSVADYADTAIRTTTAQAYNSGTFTQAAEDGFEWMEVFDGTACGWSFHDSGDLANGTVRSLEDCKAQPLSHPRCARSFAPRPDITTPGQAKAAQQGTDAERAAAAELERERAGSQPVRLSVAKQAGRQPREGRGARALRKPRADTEAQRKAIKKAQKTAARAEDTAKLTELADELGVTLDDVIAARKQIPVLQRTIRVEAKSMADQARGWMQGYGSPFDGLPGPGIERLQSPPLKKRVKNSVTGRVEWTRNWRDVHGRTMGGGEWDWVDLIDPDELHRLQTKGAFNKLGQAPDQLHQVMVDGYGDIELDEAVEHWLRHQSLEDFGRSVASGRQPGGGHRVDWADIAPETTDAGYDVSTVFSAKPGNDFDAIEAIVRRDLEVAERVREEVAENAYEELTGGFRGVIGDDYRAQFGPEPWRMSRFGWEDELRQVDELITAATDAGESVPYQLWRRWNELVPTVDYDETGRLMTFDELWAKMDRLSRNAGLRSDA